MKYQLVYNICCLEVIELVYNICYNQEAKGDVMNYKIKEDTILIREFFQLSQDALAEEIGVDKITIGRTEIGDTYPREELMEKIYDYCFTKGLKLNIHKEVFYKEDISSGHIVLTHASKTGIDGPISLVKGRINTDFGNGFYCGEAYEKSVSFICKFPNACVYFYDFNPVGLKSIHFKVDTEWMLAIAYFRGRLDAYKHHERLKQLIDSIEKVDYIVAPIADNRMFQIIDTFIDGEITDEQCKHCLAATNLGLQYVFKSNQSLEHIELLERCFVSRREKEFVINQQAKIQKEGEDKSKLARIQYRGKGKYLEELLS